MRRMCRRARQSRKAAELWDRFAVHYTPTHGSWLNQAEIEIGMFTAVSGETTNSQSEDPKDRGKSLEPPREPDRVKIAWKFDRKAARRGSAVTIANPSSGQRPSDTAAAEGAGVNAPNSAQVYDNSRSAHAGLQAPTPLVDVVFMSGSSLSLR
jgi:hypothetical protein